MATLFLKTTTKNSNVHQLINKQNVDYSYSRILLIYKKSNEILTHTTTLMNRENIIQGKIARHKTIYYIYAMCIKWAKYGDSKGNGICSRILFRR